MGTRSVREGHIAVVGGGIVGLALGIEALERGNQVTIIERDDPPRGASVRNFGHCCVTAQGGIGLDRAIRSRRRWLDLSAQAGFWVGETGTMLIGRTDEECQVLAEFADRSSLPVDLLGPDQTLNALPGFAATDIQGAALLPMDLRTNPREALHCLQRWFAKQPNVTWMGATNCTSASEGVVHTNRGVIEADRVFLAVNHDVDRLAPESAHRFGVTRCVLQMLRVTPAEPMKCEPALLSGWSLLRYKGFDACPSLPLLRERLSAEYPEMIAADVNLMATQLPNGDLLLGDTHTRSQFPEPFSNEAWDELLLSHGARFLGQSSLMVRERWQGVYASAPEEFLVDHLDERTTAVSVTTGIGMTTAFGFAEDVLAA